MHPSKDRARELGVEMVELDDLYRRSDVVSLHLRQSPDTAGFIGEREFGLMKPTAIFVNTARGAITDEKALLKALEEKRIAGAGLDVYSQEPLPPNHPITKLPNVVLTPHSGGITKEALEAGLQLAIENVFSFLAGQPRNVVTL
jgi:phosphoglycerate dehydrogenase-like enzyme